MKHAISVEARLWTRWPSIARDSELLAERCAEGLMLRAARERLEFYFEQFQVAA